jgi:hypothetical protein
MVEFERGGSFLFKEGLFVEGDAMMKELWIGVREDPEF